MSERIARVERVLEARRTIVERIQLELSTLTRAASAAERAAEQARAEWLTAMDVTPAAFCSSSDLAEQHAYTTTLRLRYSAREGAARTASQHRDACSAKLQAARIEVKKIELWIDRIREAESHQEATRQNRTMDELATRMRRTG